jgi:hypothetical protein
MHHKFSKFLFSNGKKFYTVSKILQRLSQKPGDLCVDHTDRLDVAEERVDSPPRNGLGIWRWAEGARPSGHAADLPLKRSAPNRPDTGRKPIGFVFVPANPGEAFATACPR